MATEIVAGVSMPFVKVGKTSDIFPGFARAYDVSGQGIAVVSVEGKLYAFRDHCPHMGAQLSQGLLAGKIVTCPLHGSQFDVTTGERIYGPAKDPIKTYQVKIDGEDLFVDTG